MLNIVFDAKNNLDVHIPRSELALVRLAEAYVARETALPPEAQQPSPPLSQVQALLSDVTSALLNQQAAEASRAMASHTYQGAFAQAEALLRRGRDYLAWQHVQALPLLEQWGFNVVMGKRGPRVKLPSRQDEWLWLLERYVAYEATLLPEAQVPDPSLAEMQALLATLQQSRSSRDAGEHNRQLLNETGNVEAERLRNLLKAAVTNLVALSFDGRVTADLRLWGFDVTVAANGSSNGVDEGIAEPVAPEPEPAPV